MIVPFRNLAIALGAFVGALVLGAGLQELFVRLLPAARAILLGPIDIGSWVGFATVFLSFCAAGAAQGRWLRSSAILAWSLSLPILLVVAAEWQGIGAPSCIGHWNILRGWTRVSCAMLTAIVLSPLAGTITGFLVLRLRRHCADRGGGR
jgi:hypothetical protein